MMLESIFCMPESFNTNILHQLFDHKITFHNTRTQIQFCTHKPVLNVRFKDF